MIDHMNAIGAPFAREYGGSLATRSFGGVQVSRTYYTRGQTGQQLQIAASQALLRQVQRRARSTCTPEPRCSTSSSPTGVPTGIVTRNLVTGEVRATTGHAVVLATGGYGNVFFRSTLARELQRHRGLARSSSGRAVRVTVVHPVPSDRPAGQLEVAVQNHPDE